MHTASMIESDSGNTVAAISYMRSDLDKCILIEHLTTNVLHERKGLGKQLVMHLKKLSRGLEYNLFVVSLFESVPYWQNNGFFQPFVSCDEFDLYEDCVVLQMLPLF